MKQRAIPILPFLMCEFFVLSAQLQKSSIIYMTCHSMSVKINTINLIENIIFDREMDKNVSQP